MGSLKIIKTLAILLFCSLCSCQEDDAPSVAPDPYPITSFSGRAGNEKVNLQWESPEDRYPNKYIISWSPGNETVELDRSNRNYEVSGLSNGTEYSFSIEAFYEGLGTSEKNEIKLTPASEPNDETLKEKQILAAGSNKVLLYEQDNTNATFSKIWEWSPYQSSLLPKKYQDSYFNHIDECKPLLESNSIMVTASTGGVAVINRASSEVSFFTRVRNAHSIEKLPGNKIAVAASTHEEGNAVFVYNDNELDAKNIYKEPLYGAHGLVWDDTSKLLFALGTDDLVAYELEGDGSKSFKLKEKYRKQLPTKGGHDLSQNPNDNNELIITIVDGVWKFDKETQTFDIYSPLDQQKDVKSVSLSKSKRLMYVQAEESFWSHTIRFFDPEGSISVPEINLYKARWVQ